MSASTRTTTAFDNISDANFRAWVAAFIAAVVAGGWVQTSDTGQINTATVLAPVAANTSQGYAIFRSNDTGGSITEFYIKLEFGSAAGAANRPAIWITIAWGSDGAGNLNGVTSTRTQVGSGAIPSGASLNIHFASGSGYLVICETSGTAAEHIFLSIERTRDNTLAFKNQVFISASVAGVFGSGGAYFQVSDQGNAYPALANNVQNIAGPANANTPIAAVAGLTLFFGFAPGATSPSINYFAVETNAIGAYNDLVTISILSVNHSFKLQRTLAPFASAVILTRYE
jgi:hypothetical protein